MTIAPSPQAQAPVMAAMSPQAQMLCAVPQPMAAQAPAPQQAAGLALILCNPNIVDRMIGALGPPARPARPATITNEPRNTGDIHS